ncbi:protein PROCA1 [Pogona vitticeps]
MARPGLGTCCLFWALLGAAGAGSDPDLDRLCLLLGEAQEGQLAFQASDGREVLSAAWAPRRPRRLRACRLSGEPPAVAAFLRLCRPRGSPEEEEGHRRPPFRTLEEAKAACRASDGDRRPGEASGAPRRAKRGFTYPGTLWCGAGNIAASYQELGEHRETDRCCRQHDHCHHVIHPFTYKYGYRNYRWHTISHCDCDNQLKACLRAVNDTASRVVGQAFFNVIQVPCFKFIYKEQCVEPYLYMWCKNYSMVAVAVPQEPVLYEYGGEVIDGPATRRTTVATPSSTATPRDGSLRPPKPGQPATAATETPGFPARTDLSPKKGWKGKDRKGKRKGKGRKSRKGKGLKKKTGEKAKVSPGQETTASPKRLAAHEVGKTDLETLAGFPDLREEDPFNAILSDDPGGATHLQATKDNDDGAEAESKAAGRGRATPGPRTPAAPARRQRKGRRQRKKARGDSAPS